MVVVTGAYGFIGSCLVGFLNQQGIFDIIAVDDFSKKHKDANLTNGIVKDRIGRDVFHFWFEKNAPSVPH
jgi:ADP-L-glycero-D-manno-heptose 6-epimerase